MTENEIVRSYKECGCKSSQIQILAELNALDDDDIDFWKYKIVCILRDHGILKEDSTTRKIDFKATGRNAFMMMSKFVGDCITAMDGASPQEQAMYLREIDEAREYLGGLVHG